jgi:hypothetical protein
MTKIVDVLLDSFNHEAKMAKVVLAAAKSVDMDYTPGQGMKPLRELANHLAQIPSLDHRMYSREIETAEQVQAQEKALSRNDLDGMLSVFDDGVAAVNAKFRDMSDQDLLENKLKPFYETRSEKNWAHYMPEFIRHIAMHKMQLPEVGRCQGRHDDLLRCPTQIGKLRHRQMTERESFGQLLDVNACYTSKRIENITVHLSSRS